MFSANVIVEEGAQVRYSILMPGAHVEAGARVDYCIIGENAVVPAGAMLYENVKAGERR